MVAMSNTLIMWKKRKSLTFYIFLWLAVDESVFICLCVYLIRIIFLSLLDIPQSPIFLHDRYSSPAAGSAKRRLFGDDPPTQSPVKRISVTPIKIIPNTTENNQNTTTTTTVFSLTTGNGQQLTIPLPGTTFVFC